MSTSVQEAEAGSSGDPPTPRPAADEEAVIAGSRDLRTRLLDRIRARHEALPPRVKRMLPDATVYGLYLALAVWSCLRQWAHPYDRVSAHLIPDNIQFYWWLTHGSATLTELTNPLFSHRMNAPEGVNMMANTSILGVSLPLAPVTLLFGPQVSYLVYLTLALAGSAGACYYVLSRHLVRSRVAAFIGGAFFGFAPGIIHHANGQPNFVSNFLLPFIVLRVIRLREHGRVIRNALALAALVCWQLFINEEALLLTAVAAVALVVIYTVTRPAEARRVARPFLASGFLAVGIAVPLLAYPIWFQFFGPRSYHGIPHVFTDWGEDMLAWFTFSRDTLAGSNAVERSIGASEQNSWFGAPLMVLLAVIVILTWRRSLAARIATVMAVVFAALAVGPYVRLITNKIESVPGPWRLIQELPLIGFMIPSRMVYVVIGCVAVLLAVACDTLPRLEVPQSPVPFRRLWYFAVAVALIPIIPKPMPVTGSPNVPAFISQGHWKAYVDDRHTLLTVPIPNNTIGIKALLWQSVAQQGYAMPRGYFLGPDQYGNGRFGAVPRSTEGLIWDASMRDDVPMISYTDRKYALTDLRHWRVAIVVLDPKDPDAKPLKTTMTQLLGVEPQYDHGVWLWDVRPLVDGGTR